MVTSESQRGHIRIIASISSGYSIIYSGCIELMKSPTGQESPIASIWLLFFFLLLVANRGSLETVFKVIWPSNVCVDICRELCQSRIRPHDCARTHIHLGKTLRFGTCRFLLQCHFEFSRMAAWFFFFFSPSYTNLIYQKWQGGFFIRATRGKDQLIQLTNRKKKQKENTLAVIP